MKKKLVLVLVLILLFIMTGCSSPLSTFLDGNKLIIVNGNSMSPTLKDGDKVIYKKVDKLNRFDIIVINYQNDIIIKRIYGLPGETIEIKNGIIYVNDKKIDDQYAYGNTNYLTKITLEDDEYFVLGDNREISLDSRHIGPIKKVSIKGKIKN